MIGSFSNVAADFPDFGLLACVYPLTLFAA
jgi:hypothetical protein